MKVSDLIPRIRDKIQDSGIEYTDSDVINYINEAIAYLSNLLISANDPNMVVEQEVKDQDTIPNGFVKFAGLFPLSPANGKFNITNGDASVSARYFCMKPAIALITDTVPFQDQYSTQLVNRASIIALNRNEFNVAQDISMDQDINGTAANARR